MTRRISVAVLLLLGVFGLAACGSSKKSSAPSQALVDLRDQKQVAVDAKNDQFAPPNIEITQGTKVTWTNRDSVAHNVQKFADTVDFGAPFGVQAGQFGPGATYSFTFTKVGEYKYTCTIHTLMDGTVHVVARGTAVSSTTG